MERTDRLTQAAVLVPIFNRHIGASVLLTLRTGHLRAHPGQICFPGGRASPTDANAIVTALRESEEEIGIAPNAVTVLDCLDDYQTGSGFNIRPIVGLVRPDSELRLNEAEVAAVLEVPLAFVLDERNYHIESTGVSGAQRQYFTLEFARQKIWGATAGILHNMLKKVRANSKFDAILENL